MKKIIKMVRSFFSKKEKEKSFEVEFLMDGYLEPTYTIHLTGPSKDFIRYKFNLIDSENRLDIVNIKEH